MHVVDVGLELFRAVGSKTHKIPMEARGAINRHAESLDAGDLAVSFESLIWFLRRKSGVTSQTKAQLSPKCLPG